MLIGRSSVNVKHRTVDSILVLLTLLSSLTLSVMNVHCASYQLSFVCWFVSGDSAARDYFISVDGSVVARGVMFGTGTLSTAITLSDSGHWIEAWPIINHDRSVYSGELYINGRLVVRSSDVHSNNKLRYYISSSQPPLGPTTTRVYLWIEVLDDSTGQFLSGASVYWDGVKVGLTGSDGRLRIDTVYPPVIHRYQVTVDGYDSRSGSVSTGASSGGGFTVRLSKSSTDTWRGNIDLATWWLVSVQSEKWYGCGQACVASVINYKCGENVLSFQDVDEKYSGMMSISQVVEALTYYANLYGLDFEGKSIGYNPGTVKRLLGEGTPMIIHIPGHFVVAIAYNDNGELLAGTSLLSSSQYKFSPGILDSAIYLG